MTTTNKPARPRARKVKVQVYVDKHLHEDIKSAARRSASTPSQWCALRLAAAVRRGK